MELLIVPVLLGAAKIVGAAIAIVIAIPFIIGAVIGFIVGKAV
jgi:hypothetical protein